MKKTCYSFHLRDRSKPVYTMHQESFSWQPIEMSLIVLEAAGEKEVKVSQAFLYNLAASLTFLSTMNDGADDDDDAVVDDELL